MSNRLFSPLTLPNGAVIPNRLAKAAMSESLAAPGQLPDRRLARLYEAWARAARVDGAQVWMQINHPGRQVMAAMGQPGWGPSDVALDLGKHSKLAAKPQAMSEAEIGQTITRFADAARQAEAARFTGVQIHAAHGYLISQFLSPLTNRRTDHWGGSLENRARLLLEGIKAVRSAVSAGFCVAVKLNSADFQRGGFDVPDAQAVVKLLNGCAVDLVELSGGSYEAPAMQGDARDGRTLEREAYFLEFAREIARSARMPIMTTGGIHRRAVAEGVLSQGVAMVGLATALAMNPGLPRAWQGGSQESGIRPSVAYKNKLMATLATAAIIKRQLHRIADGLSPVVAFSALYSLIRDQLRTKCLTRRYRAWAVSSTRRAVLCQA